MDEAKLKQIIADLVTRVQELESKVANLEKIINDEKLEKLTQTPNFI